MNDLITQSYWLLFDYIKPCLTPRPTIEYSPITATHDDVHSPSLKFLAITSYELSYTFQGKKNWESLKKTDNYQKMIDFMNNPTGMTATITCLFSELKNHGEYEVFLAVLKNMILGEIITKDECVKILTESENYEALTELLQFDAGEDSERFDL